MRRCSLAAFRTQASRVFDIRDPYRPKEIAYWKPAAVRTEVRPGSGSWAPGVDRTVDKISGWARWVVAGKGNGHIAGNNRNGKGAGNGNGTELQLWTVSDGNGFQILRFTGNFKAKHPDLFEAVSQ